MSKFCNKVELQVLNIYKEYLIWDIESTHRYDEGENRGKEADGQIRELERV